VGNIPTEEVVRTLAERGVEIPIQDSLERVMQISGEIADEFSAAE
jgi:hypothetical protein